MMSKTIARVLRMPQYLLFFSILAAVAGKAQEPLIYEDFETPDRTPLYNSLAEHPLLEVVDGQGVDGGKALQATYEGYERGSRRIVARVPLPEQQDEMSLSYDVRFAEGFQFVRGGKLHGLGPENPVTGGNPMTPEGWSARINFGGNGHIRTYLYIQDHDGKYGRSEAEPGFAFAENRYQAVTLHVRLNDPADEANGFARVYVDGERKVDHSDVRFRTTDSAESLISQFLFSTFHGGSNPDWAPKTPEGDYATHHAWFDNFAIYPGEKIRTEPGACRD